MVQKVCGICGWLDINRKIDYRILEKMNNIAKHRGPDDEGYVVISAEGNTLLRGQDTCKIENAIEIKEFNKDAFLAFGHRRLSIIDLSEAGHQPMWNRNGTICITFNGEIYNYIELKQELEILGHCFYTHSDTEVLLSAYMEWGEECVNHLNGMWAFAIWDERNKKLFCSRDRLGAKPFYYYRDNERFLFSSEIKQLCVNPIVPRVLNEKVMVAQIMWGITDYSEETLIKDIFTLPGGCNLLIKLSDNKIEEFRVEQYWDINTTEEKKSIEQSDVFEKLRDAIRIRTRSDVPIGVLLSGGLDSSCLVAEISEYYREQGKDCSELNTYTSCYNNFREGDEKEFAREVNNYCKTKQNFIYPDEQDTFGCLEKMVWHMEGNCGFSVLGSFMTLEQIAGKGAKVLINGQGSDETMFGYERYYAFYFKDLLEKGEFRKLFTEYKKASGNSRLSVAQLLEYFAYFSFPIVRKSRCMHRMRKYVSRNVRKIFSSDKSVHSFLFFDSLQQLQYNELRKTQLTHILRMDDRAYMAFSLESRVPYIDYRYVEEAVKIKEEQKIEQGYTKYLLRKFVDGRLPDSVVWRKNKMGWPSPKKRWVSRFDKNRVNELFDNARCSYYFDIPALKALYKKHPDAWPIEQFMIMELFVRLFDIKIEYNGLIN